MPPTMASHVHTSARGVRFQSIFLAENHPRLPSLARNCAPLSDALEYSGVEHKYAGMQYHCGAIYGHHRACSDHSSSTPSSGV